MTEGTAGTSALPTGSRRLAILVQSRERFDSFRKAFADRGVECVVIDFDRNDWITMDYSQVDYLVYFPSFRHSSNHPLSLHRVHDNLVFLHRTYPHLKMFPDPSLVWYYNDKYRQYLFLTAHGIATPDTIALVSTEALSQADRELGYPMVIKNRFGAGGGAVFLVRERRQLERFHRISRMDLFHGGTVSHLWSLFSRRIFYYHAIKERNMPYPFLSSPLLAQRFVEHECDLKTVVFKDRVVEAHWRRRADAAMWKVNIDGGGVGEWSRVPSEPIELSLSLARSLECTWLNVDLLPDKGRYLVSEFSPVWHHYAYREKPSFVYRDDYNIGVPLERSLNLEVMIVQSLLAGGV